MGTVQWASSLCHLLFIINSQIKKRNLNDFEKAAYIVVLKKILARKEAKERQNGGLKQFQGADNQDSTVDQHAGQRKDEMEGKVDRILAKEAGVSHNTISQVSKILDHASEDTKQKIFRLKLLSITLRIQQSSG